MHVWNQECEDLLNALKEEKKILALTGAGISIASGLPLGRTEFDGVPVSQILTQSFFEERPKAFYKWFRHAVSEWSNAKPNAAHVLLHHWEIDVITQNIDHLHIESMNSHVLELHGSLRNLLCVQCQARFQSALCFREELPSCPTCKHSLHPDIVFVGERVHQFSKAVDWICNSEVLLVIGTKLEMYPCRELLEMAKRNHLQILNFNRDAVKVLQEVEKLYSYS